MVGPLLLAVTALAFVWLGYELAIRRWLPARSAQPPNASAPSAAPGPLELWNAAFTIGAASWIATVWLLALLHLLDRPATLLRTVAVLAAAVMMFLRRTRGRIENRQIDEDFVRRYVLPLLPIGLWIIFILWRSTCVPPLSHDALAYHLPRAVLWIREHAFFFIDLPVDPRMRILPVNYEMLLADVMLLCGNDAVTEWLGVFFYVAMLVAAGSLAERWWQRSKDATLAVVLLTASIPVLLLHTGADKNDSMTAFFMLAALTWTGRWFSEGDVNALVLCGISVIAAIGTKPQGLMLGAALFPFVIWRLVHEVRGRRVTLATLARVLAISLIAAILLGGAFFIARATQESAVAAAERRGFVAYDDWSNLWQAPWVLLAAPFSPSPYQLYVPWSDTPWFWQRYEIYFSHLGIPFTLCTLLLPFAIRSFRRDARERATERHAMFLAALATVVLMFPVHDVPMPHGVYTIALPRYVMFFAPAVFGLCAAPALARLSSRSRAHAMAITTALVVLFLYRAIDNGANDRFVPIEYVLDARQHPGTRVIAVDPRRAASVVDMMAGPRDVIAFDAGYGAWIQPAFGRDLQRPVRFVSGLEIPADAQWVIVDRGFRTIWQLENFHDLSQARRYLGEGRATEEETRLVQALRHDPRFRAAALHPLRNQAVFRRVR